MPEQLVSIHIYPVKSTRGIDLEASVVEPQGLRFDRRWMVVDGDAVALTQRTVPRLALIRSTIREDGLELSADGEEPVFVPLPRRDGGLTVDVWDDVVDAAPADDAAHRWLSRYLNTDCRLVYLDDPSRRRVDPDFDIQNDDVQPYDVQTYDVQSNPDAADGAVVSFADAFPILLTNTASLAALNARLDRPLPMSRFRPNLVVSGCEPFDEDTWSEVRIGGLAFHVAKPCARCTVTTIDQESASRGKEPLRTLATFRRRDGKVYFGQNLIPLKGGRLERGDEFVVTKRKKSGLDVG